MADGLTDAWIGETNGETITVRCTLDPCPQPQIGVFIADMYHPASGQHAADLHWFGQHYLPARQEQILDGMNANPSSLEAHWPDISETMAEFGLRFTFGAS